MVKIPRKPRLTSNPPSRRAGRLGEAAGEIHAKVFAALERHPDDPDLWILMCWTAPSPLAARSYLEALAIRYQEFLPAIAGLDLTQPAWEDAGDGVSKDASRIFHEAPPFPEELP